MIQIVIADDHKIMLEGLVSLTKEDKTIKIVDEVLNGQQVLEVLQKEKKVDVVILDIEMPEMDGIEATKLIRQKYPAVKVLILTMYNEIGFIRKIIEAGAHGYILKNKGKEELVYAIHKVYEGNEHFGEEVSKTLINSMKTKGIAGEVKLTKREIDVLKLIADEYTTPMISKELHIAPTTVETHRRNLIVKTGVSSTIGLVRFAVEKGYTN